MTAPAVIHNGSDIVAVVERARALFTEGDVMAARMLASAAYDMAKAAAGLGARFKAGTVLIGKAHRLQGDALLIETRAKIMLADEYDPAQESGAVRKPGQRGKAVIDDNRFSIPTVGELGLTKIEVHAARKLSEAERRAPGIVERAIEARLAAGLQPSRANIRSAVGTVSATAAERGNNLYGTPPEAVWPLLALETFSPIVREPACGRGAISRLLEAAGYDVLLSDLVDYGTADRRGELQSVQDFLASTSTHKTLRRRKHPQPGTDIVTNPPYGTVVNAFVAHAPRVHRPRKMALLLNLNFLAGFDDPDRGFAMDEHPPATVYVFTRRLPMMHRDGWEGPEASSRMNTAWFVWRLRQDGGYRSARRTELVRVDWKDYGPAASAEVLP